MFHPRKIKNNTLTLIQKANNKMPRSDLRWLPWPMLWTLEIPFPNSWPCRVLGNYVLVFLAPFGADVHTSIVSISEPGRLDLVGSYLKMKHLHVCA